MRQPTLISITGLAVVGGTEQSTIDKEKEISETLETLSDILANRLGITIHNTNVIVLGKGEIDARSNLHN